MYWSLRRELWENRSIYVAPLAVAAVIVFASMFGGVATLFTGAAKPHLEGDKLAQPFNIAALMLMATTFLVAIFYCLDALYGERRDRSVLFWKSQPVSDRTTVLSKAAIPIFVLPLLTFIITLATQLIMLLLGSVIAMLAGRSAMALWTLPWMRMSSMLLYHLIAMHGLYYAPIFGWLLFVSAWARRAPFLWALLPPLAIGFIERIVFNSSHFAAMLSSRISGGETAKQASMEGMMLGPFTPGEFLSSPGLWIGLAIMAAFLVAAMRLRRDRGPI